MKIILLAPVVIFFAMNMGASGIAPSFAATWGAKLVNKKQAAALFTLFVILGAVTLGRGVSLTLGKNLLPQDLLDFKAAMIILAATTLSLFTANILKIPQSTSQVTVGSIVGAGLYFKQLNIDTLCCKILPAWVILPLLSYFFTWLIYRKIYPPKQGNLYIYQKVFTNEKKLKLCALLSSCYVAFAIGTNNVGNAVGPLFGARIIGINLGLILVAPLFGIGAFLFGKGNLETAGKEIVPLGLFSSTLVSFVTATLLIVASILGIPQSLVQLNLFSIFTVGCLKNGYRSTIAHQLTKKTFFIWAITPLIAAALAYLLLFLVNKRLPG